jgi:chemotaxis protein methyltransferase WspC
VPTPVASQPSAASKPFPQGDRPQSAAPTHAAPPARRDLVAARQLADAGKLAEAAAICQAHLNNHGPSAQAYYLLGLVRDADGDAQAMDCYRKALYLEPNHYETLLQMSLLLERNGDATGARTFKRRADRVEAQARRATKLDHASIETPAAAADVYAAERVLQKP